MREQAENIEKGAKFVDYEKKAVNQVILTLQITVI